MESAKLALTSDRKGTEKMKIFLIGICLAAGATMLAAQDDSNFPQLMKTINGQMGAVRKIESKTGPEAAEAAKKISDAFAQVAAYWTSKNAEDAVKLSNDGKAAADELAAAAGSGDSAAANAAFKKIGGTCGACHSAHREKTESGFKIK
jgi:cytochrome c556